MAKNKDRIFQDAEDKNVAQVVVYANESKALFYDSAFTAAKAVPAEDCLNLFYKGVVALFNGVYYSAKSCTTAGVIDFGFPVG